MSPGTSDRNLLVGMLAFQNGFVRREQLLGAMNAWLVDKDTPLEDILLRQGDLNSDQQQLLVALVRQHLAMHDNVAERSLAAVSSLGSVRDELRSLADPDLNASLVHVVADSVMRGSPDPEQTIPPTVGAPTSQGGRFRILRPHARGGLGEVHVALDTELNREVALKEIQARHADHPQSRARFTLEAEITGGLEHPSIVPVYGLGTYADGRPYYAMRFIRGDSLAERIEKFHREDAPRDPGQRTLELHKLLRRFIDVCEAIQYAHDRGVLHRDLKPGNIMLGKYGETLVVDWGLAKPVSGSRGPSNVDTASTLPDEPPLVPTSGSGSAPTEMGAVVGTPAYMSPEQASGRLDQLGPVSDVYSLGATLYCLLTGRPPFELAQGGAGELLKRVSTGDFPQPRQVSPTVPKPLEAVCLKAMALKPSGRYANPAQLRDDLEHWLADEPVTAATETLVERSARFARKHRSWALATAAALLLVAAVSIAAALLINEQKNQNADLAADNLQLARQEEAARRMADAKRAEAETARQEAQANARRADEQSALALKTLNTVVYSIQGELAEIPAARPVRQKLLTHALDGLQAVAGAADTSRQASRSQFVTHNELGNMLSLVGSPHFAEQRQKAYEIALRLAEADPANGEAQRDLWVACNKLGEERQALGNLPEAKQHFERGLAISRRLAEGDPAGAQAQRDLSVSYNFLGSVSLALGELLEAKKHFEQYLEISRRLAEADPTNAEAQRDVAIPFNKLGEVSLAMQNLPEAKKHFEQYLEITRRRAEADAANSQAQSDLSIAYSRLGDVHLALRNIAEAKECFEQDLEISRRLAEADPDNAQFQRGLAIAYDQLGEVSLAKRNVPEAKTHFEQSLKIFRRLTEANPAIAEAQRDVSVGYEKLGDTDLALGNVAEAKQHYEQALDIRLRLAEADSANARAQIDVAYSYTGLAKSEIAAKNHAAAKERLAQSIALLEKLEGAGQLKHRANWLSLLSENRKLLADCERQLATAKE
ncbi:MAG: tetratricopeptide repeat protein [Pirellulales bacterium]